jgi:PBP1b-binding outer membrane lipoprotein LpoB
MKKSVLALTLLGLLVAGCATAPAPKPTVQQSVNRYELAYLRNFIGKRADDMKLWESQPLQGRLQALLGADYETFISSMREQIPLAEDSGVIYTIGRNEQTKGGAVFMADIANDVIEVKQVSGRTRQIKDYGEPGPALKVPAKVEQALKVFQRTPRTRM